MYLQTMCSEAVSYTHLTSFEGTRATPEFLQAIAYEVYVKNVTFGLLHQWLTDMGMTLSLIHIYMN